MDTDAANELKTSVSEGKFLIATTVTGKGIQTVVDNTFQTMATNIGSILTGYTSISSINNGMNIGGGGYASIYSHSFTDGTITLSFSGRTNASGSITGHIYIHLA